MAAYPPPSPATAQGGMPTYVVGAGQSLSVAVPATPSAGSKRSAGAAALSDEQDYLEFTPLGSGCEVGRSCHILKFKGKTIMLDAGLHPAYVGVSSLPFFDEIEPSAVDLLLVSHFHLDHAAALPYFLEKTEFAGKTYMTHPTKSIYKLILQDYIKVSHLSVEDVLYTEQDLLNSMDKIDVVNFHQVVHYKGIKFWALNAGHVLGAAMFVIEIAGIRVLYTGDYSRREDRHLMSAELPDVPIDVLVVEATYGIQKLPPVAEREQRFTELVREIVEVRRGKCLLPVFALGRAQELLLILDEYWAAHPTLQAIPIYYASALAKKTMSVYRTFINMMNAHIRERAQVSNPFAFKHIFNLKGANIQEVIDDTGPCVVMASPGMLQNGLSRELLEMWASDAENGCVMTGYCVEGTLAKHILTEPEYIQSMSGGAKIPLNMSVTYISFSAHADYTETSEFVDLIKPPYVILVHGDASEGCGRLRYALETRYKDGSVRILAPRNLQTVELQFRSAKVAKAVGTLALQPPSEGTKLSGLLVRKNYTDYTLIQPEELSTFTTLSSTTVEQSLKVPFHQTFECMRYFVGQMYHLDEDDEVTDDADMGVKPELTTKSEGGVEEEKKQSDAADDPVDVANTITVHSSVRLTWKTQPSPHVLVRWQSNPVNDMLSDSLIAILTNIQSNPGMAKVIGSAGECRNAGIGGHTHSHGVAIATVDHSQHDHAAAGASTAAAPASAFPSVEKPAAAATGPSFRWFLEQHYGSDLTYDAVAQTYAFTLNTVPCQVHVRTLEVECADAELRKRISMMVRRAHAACHPITKHNTSAVVELEQDEQPTAANANKKTAAPTPTPAAAPTNVAPPAAV